MSKDRSQGLWHVYHPGWCALYVVMSIALLLFLLLMWSTGQVAFPGLLGILFVVMAGRQLWLRANGGTSR